MNVLEFEFRYLYNIMQYMILSVISVNQVRLFLVAPFQVPVVGIFYYIPIILGGQISLLIILAIYQFGALID
jgi:hypothetical protein